MDEEKKPSGDMCRSGWQREVAEVPIAESVYSWTRLLSFKRKLESAVDFAGY